jgi:hypothetical protein
VENYTGVSTRCSGYRTPAPLGAQVEPGKSFTFLRYVGKTAGQRPDGPSGSGVSASQPGVSRVTGEVPETCQSRPLGGERPALVVGIRVEPRRAPRGEVLRARLFALLPPGQIQPLLYHWPNPWLPRIISAGSKVPKRARPEGSGRPVRQGVSTLRRGRERISEWSISSIAGTRAGLGNAAAPAPHFHERGRRLG